MGKHRWSKYKWILDPGHSGVAFGHYMTPGKRTPGKRKSTDYGIFEGGFNRDICARVERMNDRELFNCDIITLVPGPIRVPLKDRYNFVNKLAKKEKCILIDVHANAWPPKKSVNGYVVFNSPAASRTSEYLASYLYTKMMRYTQLKAKYRKIQKRRFSMIHRTTCPAVLLECGFMTNEKDTDYMMSYEGREQIAEAIYNTIVDFEDSYE